MTKKLSLKTAASGSERGIPRSYLEFEELPAKQIIKQDFISRDQENQESENSPWQSHGASKD